MKGRVVDEEEEEEEEEDDDDVVVEDDDNVNASVVGRGAGEAGIPGVTPPRDDVPPMFNEMCAAGLNRAGFE